MDNIRKIVRIAVLKILKPIARMLLRYDISHSEFAELAKYAYVDAAFKHFALPNRKQTVSRVSVLTGLSRKEIVRISAIEPEQELETKRPLNRATQVIGGWLKDPVFMDSTKNPKEIPLKNAEDSFEALVNKYSGGITPRAILVELIRVGAVEKIGKQSVRLVNSGYVPKDSAPEMLDLVSTHTADLLSTGIHNITHERHEARFQRQVVYTQIPDRVAKEFQQISHDKALALLIELNQWLADKKASELPAPQEPVTRIGMGVYFFKNKKGDS